MKKYENTRMTIQMIIPAPSYIFAGIKGERDMRAGWYFMAAMKSATTAAISRMVMQVA